jgi:predicted ArsR family transcriptional regulator
MSQENEIPPDVRAFIVQRIDSVLQLELMLLLHANAIKHWSADEVAKELRIEASAAQEQLDLLTGRGLLQLSDSDSKLYRYQSSDTSLDATMGKLSGEYASRRVTVISLIYSKPTDTLKSFANAFRIFRKENNDG